MLAVSYYGQGFGVLPFLFNQYNDLLISISLTSLQPVSADNKAGNESNLVKSTVYLDFTVPEVPGNLRVEDI
jgi:hypothetical protein